MTFIFYLFTMAALMWEVKVLRNPQAALDFFNTLKDRPTKEEFTMTQGFFVALMIGYGIWCFTGILLSDQWLTFLVLGLLGWIPWRKGGPQAVALDSVLSILLLLYIVLNHYHFHIDTWEWFKSLFT